MGQADEDWGALSNGAVPANPKRVLVGGIAAVVDWRRPIDTDSLDTMMGIVPHRGPSGVQQFRSNHAHVAEARTTTERAWSIVTDNGVTIVGDFRLWNKGPLQDMAGGRAASAELDDRQLVLAAYRRVGWQRTLDALDGDFAFVIWDAKHRSLVVARDRFGVIPLHYQRTPTGIRVATEPKQLLVVADHVRPDHRAIAHHLMDRRTCKRDTYFEGVHRVLPSEVLKVTEDSFRQHQYWNPEPATDLSITADNVPHVYREHLTDALKRRLETSSMTISQLSGGLDSTAIAASAQILTERGFDAERFATVSYIVPGSTVDESKWISEIEGQQSFAHHDFVPKLAGIDVYQDDMWTIDRPSVMPDRDFFLETGSYGKRMGAELLLVGIAGDDLIDDFDLIADMIRQRSLARAWQTFRATAAWSGSPPHRLGIDTLRRLVPQPMKDALHCILPSRSNNCVGLLTEDLCEFSSQNPCHVLEPVTGFSSETQANVASATRSRNLVQASEEIEAHAARFGLGVSHPHLDRGLVEFVASIPVSLRTADGTRKSIVRQAYRGVLPDSVLDRTSSTYANDYMIDLLLELAPAFKAQFPSVPESAAGFIDADAYSQSLRELHTDRPSISAFQRIWPAWTLMMWLDTLNRYGR